MSRKCQVSGSAHQSGNRVSHANNKTKHVFSGNIQSKRIFFPSIGKRIRVKISTRILRTMDKLGAEETLKKHGLTIADISA